jgi:hypothetical protein
MHFLSKPWAWFLFARYSHDIVWYIFQYHGSKVNKKAYSCINFKHDANICFVQLFSALNDLFVKLPTFWQVSIDSVAVDNCSVDGQIWHNALLYHLSENPTGHFTITNICVDLDQRCIKVFVGQKDFWSFWEHLFAIFDVALGCSSFD